MHRERLGQGPQFLIENFITHGLVSRSRWGTCSSPEALEAPGVWVNGLPDAPQAGATVRVDRLLKGGATPTYQLRGRATSVHALIEGTLGNYMAHLGSAVVHHLGPRAMPRTDLPAFSSTTTLVAEVITLAQDRAIKDPSIFEQII